MTLRVSTANSTKLPLTEVFEPIAIIEISGGNVAIHACLSMRKGHSGQIDRFLYAKYPDSRIINFGITPWLRRMQVGPRKLYCVVYLQIHPAIRAVFPSHLCPSYF